MELRSVADDNAFPKWSSLCLLQRLGLRTLDALFLPPGIDLARTSSDIVDFAASLGTDRLLVRSDGGRERKQYLRAGCSLEIPRLLPLVKDMIDAERAVILLEPTDRFSNKLTVNILADADGALVVEVLGPGYDVADLNRGGILPQLIVQAAGLDWRRRRLLYATDITLTDLRTAADDRRDRRLNDIGARMLPQMGFPCLGDPRTHARDWLLSRGYDHLWRPWDYTPDIDTIRGWHAAISLVVEAISRRKPWRVLVLSGSDLGDGRFVFWDVVDADTKWQST